MNLVAGSYQNGFGGDGGPATSSNVKLSSPLSVYVHTNGVLYIADNYIGRVRYIVSGIINTFAGGGSDFSSGQAATSTRLSVYDVKGDSLGNIYINEYDDIRVATANGSRVIEDYIPGIPFSNCIYIDERSSKIFIGDYYILSADLYRIVPSSSPTSSSTLLSSGAIVGIVIGAVVVIGIVCFVFYYLVVRKRSVKINHSFGRVVVPEAGEQVTESVMKL